ncbi:hypothetical protein D3C85_1703770 [compost metagenome]
MSSLITIRGQRYESQLPRNVIKPSVISAGTAAGTMIRKNTRIIEAPSILAASIISFGMSAKNCRSRKMPNTDSAEGTIRLAYELTHPKLFISK